MTTNRLPTNGTTGGNGEHLPEEELNRYVDGDLDPEEQRLADIHLTSCQICTATMADLGAISYLLSALPEARAPRSFQLDAGHARKPSTLWQRFGGALLPMLPAMRAGTIALALAFASVTAYRVVEDGPSDSPDAGGNVVLYAPTDSTLASSTVAVVDAGRSVETVTSATEITDTVQQPADEAADAAGQAAEESESTVKSRTETADDADSSSADLVPAGDSADKGQSNETGPANAEEVNATDEPMTMFEAPEESDAIDGSAESAAPDTADVEMAQPAAEASPPPESTATPAATSTSQPTVTQTSSAVPTPSPTQLPAPLAEDGSDDPSWPGRAQLVLGMLTALFGGLVLGVQRLRKKVIG